VDHACRKSKFAARAEEDLPTPAMDERVTHWVCSTCPDRPTNTLHRIVDSLANLCGVLQICDYDPRKLYLARKVTNRGLSVALCAGKSTSRHSVSITQPCLQRAVATAINGETNSTRRVRPAHTTMPAASYHVSEAANTYDDRRG